MDLEQFHFLRPYWLLLLPLHIAVLWLMIKRRLGNRSWEAVCDENLLPYMLIDGSTRSRRLPVLLVGLSGLLAIVALAGPVWERLPQPVFTNETALVIALDLSRSMDSNDITPSRLVRARFKVADIINQHDEGQAALLVYAGDAFTVTPLTDDMATIASQLSALSTDIMPEQGNRTGLALEKAEQLLKGAGHTQGNILLVSDEIDFEKTRDKVRELASQGYRVSVLGIGTEHGAPVLMADGSFLKDRNGEIVIPSLKEAPLKQIAALGDGHYRRMSQDDSDIQFLLQQIAGRQSAGNEAASEFETDTWKEQGPWLLVLLIPVAALSFRRGYLLLLVAMLVPFPQTAEALSWEELWWRPDQRAQQEFDAGNPELAAELFEDRDWKGAAQYRAGNYQATLDSLQEKLDVDALYNRGNAHARLGQYQEAIDSYKKVLEQDPGHEDAKFNKELIEKELQEQQQQNQQQQNDQQNQDQQNQEQEQNDQQPQDGQENQQQDDQQNPDSEQQDQDSQSEQEKNKEDQEQTQQDQDSQADEEQEEEQQAAEQEQEQNQEETEQQNSEMSLADQEQTDEEQQATEQWLRRIPDDPAGLLRRKFLYQYQQKKNRSPEDEKTW